MKRHVFISVFAFIVAGCSANSGDNANGQWEPAECTSFEENEGEAPVTGTGRNCDLSIIPKSIVYTIDEGGSAYTLHLKRNGTQVKAELFAACPKQTVVNIKYFVQLAEELEDATKNQRAKTQDDLGEENFKTVDNGGKSTYVYLLVLGPLSETVVANEHRAALRGYVERLKAVVEGSSTCVPLYYQTM